MSKKVPIYFSDESWSTLQELMGSSGSPSPTINAILSAIRLPASAKRFSATTSMQIPVALSKVSAGFPSPAQDYIDKTIDMNEHLIKNQNSTFIVKAASLSMLNAGIDIDDELVVDRSIDAKPHDIVIALVHDDFTVKRLMQDESGYWLKAENPDYSDIRMKDGEELVIWGVVTFVLKNTRK